MSRGVSKPTCSTSDAWTSGATSTAPSRHFSSSVSNCAPMTAAAFNVRFAVALSRSMRAPMMPCRLAGTWISRTSRTHT